MYSFKRILCFYTPALFFGQATFVPMITHFVAGISLSSKPGQEATERSKKCLLDGNQQGVLPVYTL
jgi:hypothetical protein